MLPILSDINQGSRAMEGREETVFAESGRNAQATVAHHRWQIVGLILLGGVIVDADESAAEGRRLTAEAEDLRSFAVRLVRVIGGESGPVKDQTGARQRALGFRQFRYIERARGITGALQHVARGGERRRAQHRTS
jgi:hypothetical protein